MTCMAPQTKKSEADRRDESQSGYNKQTNKQTNKYIHKHSGFRRAASQLCPEVFHRNSFDSTPVSSRASRRASSKKAVGTSSQSTRTPFKLPSRPSNPSEPLSHLADNATHTSPGAGQCTPLAAPRSSVPYIHCAHRTMGIHSCSGAQRKREGPATAFSSSLLAGLRDRFCRASGPPGAAIGSQAGGFLRPQHGLFACRWLLHSPAAVTRRRIGFSSPFLRRLAPTFFQRHFECIAHGALPLAVFLG